MVFYWIGVGVVLTIAALAIIIGLIWIYAWVIHRRFNAILFRKGQRRLSLASWYNSRLMGNPNFNADDWPIGERPFYLSYRIGSKRLFVLAGLMTGPRHAVITGQHPFQTEPSA